MKIDWDAVLERMPIYAYEYEKEAEGERANSPIIDYWYPHLNPKGVTPPKGHTGIDYDLSYEGVVKAINEWVAEVLTPNEKAVWFDMNTGFFSNTFTIGELQKFAPEEIKVKVSNWKLIVYRCETDPAFEFSDMMKIVTKTKEDRKR